MLFGAPYDSTASFRPGSRGGPAAVRNDSAGIETYSPYQNADLSDRRIFDAGDLELPFGDTAAALAQIEARTAEILRSGKIPVMVGGEHTVTLGAVRAAFKRYPDLRLLHFDAHADLRDAYLGVSLSHACVIRRCHDLLGDGRIFQFGIRSGEKAEFDFAGRHTVMRRFDFNGLEETAEQLKAAGYPVYLTVDLDVLDPGVFPGTGTPEPGGVSFDELRAAVGAAGRVNLAGADVVETAPELDGSGVSTITACKILRELMLSLPGRGERV